jgi:hypothetical protein
MKGLLGAIVVVCAALSFSIATAQDFSTCSGNRDACVSGVKSRGGNPSLCISAYNKCMKTGVWDTGGGPNGRHLENVAKK